MKISEPDMPTEVYTGACIERVGSMLKTMKENENNEPVAYFSRKWTEAQKKKRNISEVFVNKKRA